MLTGLVGFLGTCSAVHVRGATLSLTDEDPDYPVAHLRDPRQAKVARTTAVAAQRFVVAVPSPLVCWAVTIHGHNFTPEAVVKAELHTANSWGSPAVSERLVNRPVEIRALLAKPWEYAFLSLYVDDPTNSAGYLELGGVHFWQGVELLQAPPLTALGRPVDDASPRLELAHGDGLPRSIAVSSAIAVSTLAPLRRGHALDLWRWIREIGGGAPAFLAPEVRTGLYARAAYGYVTSAGELKPIDPTFSRMQIGGLAVEADRA